MTVSLDGGGDGPAGLGATASERLEAFCSDPRTLRSARPRWAVRRFSEISTLKEG
jgi:hypothetical protein